MLKHNYVIHTYLHNTKIITSRKLSKNIIEKIFFILETYSKNLFFTNKEGDSYKFINSQIGISISYGPEFYMYIQKLKKYTNLLNDLRLFPIPSINEYIDMPEFLYISKKKEIDFDFTILASIFILDHIYKVLKERLFLNFLIESGDLILLKENKLAKSKEIFTNIFDGKLINKNINPKHNFIFKIELPEQEKTIKGSFSTYSTTIEPRKIILISIENLYIAKITEMFIKKHNIKSIDDIPTSLASLINIELIM